MTIQSDSQSVSQSVQLPSQLLRFHGVHPLSLLISFACVDHNRVLRFLKSLLISVTIMMEIEILNNIQWPEEGIVKRRFECAGASYCEYYANAIFLDSSSSGPSAIQAESVHSNLSIDRSPDQIIDDSSISRSGSRINLLEEEDLSSLDYYQVLDITMGQARDKDLLKKVRVYLLYSICIIHFVHVTKFVC